MIKNNRQYTYSKKKLREFLRNLEAVQEKHSSNKNKQRLYGQGYREQIAQLKAELSEYERMRKRPLPKVLHAQNPVQISVVLVRLRLARGLTQAQLAQRMGCKQADISRLEREDYEGYTVAQLSKIAKSLDAKLELNILPSPD